MNYLLLWLVVFPMLFWRVCAHRFLNHIRNLKQVRSVGSQMPATSLSFHCARESCFAIVRCLW